jgi:hypothetical protein
VTLATPLIALSRRIGRFEHPIESTRALEEAVRNFEINKSALEAVWPRSVFCVPETLAELEWLYARDGSLSARHVDGQWLSQVSIPERAARKMLGKAIVNGSSAVMIAPTHAQQIRAMLDRMSKQQVLIVVIPGEYIAGTILACADFSADIRAQRLWLACGPDWPEEIHAILDTHEGIAPPSMMIRVPGLNAETVERVLKHCETMLARHSTTHRTQLGLLQAKPRFPQRPPKKVCVVTGAFKLWDDAAYLLGQAAGRGPIESIVLDASTGTQTSALRLARTVDGCDAIVTANLSRTDLPQVVPENVPWITWMTTNRIPRPDPAASFDRLIVADASQRSLATDAGWDGARVVVGQEPIRCNTTSRAATPAIIADLPRMTMPRAVEEMSSQRLVWERVEHDITRNPFCIGSQPLEYIYNIAAEIGLGRTSFPIDTFRTELLVPCFMRSFAKLLASRGVKFAIYGRGWEAVEELASRSKGPLETDSALANALASSSILLDVWPGEPTHPARRAGKPMLRPWGRDLASLPREINRAAISTMKQNDVPVIDLQRVLESI